MKKYSVWFFLLMKRTLKIPAFVLMPAVMFAIAAAVSGLGNGERAESTAGVFIETEEGQNLTEIHEEWNQRFMSQLYEQEGILSFSVYENKEKLMQDVLKGELDCSFILPGDMSDKMADGTWHDMVTIYSASYSSVIEIAKERIAAAVFILYSEDSYVNYIKNTDIFDKALTDENSKDEDGKDEIRKEIIEFAQSAYETHLLDGSTFDFIYRENTPYESLNNDDIYKIDSTAAAENEDRNDETVPGLRGILALGIFLSGMCGLLTDWKDRNEKRFVRIAPDWLTTMANVLVPTIYTSVVSLAILFCTDEISGFGGAVREVYRLLIYQFLIVIYCSIIRLVLRKQEAIAAAIPILTMACMICCPVFIRLAVYIPVFRVLEKLFPATYYLLGTF